jgi:hypothetical protein
MQQCREEPALAADQVVVPRDRDGHFVVRARARSRCISRPYARSTTPYTIALNNQTPSHCATRELAHPHDLGLR